MKNAKVYHGGPGPGGKFSAKNNGNGSAEVITLEYTNDGNLNVGSEIPAPGGFGWFNDDQGFYFPEEYTLIEMHLLFNDFTTFSAGMSITTQLRRKLADGTNPGPVVVAQVVTVFPSGGGEYFGNSQTTLGVLIPAGYMVYGYISAKSTTATSGVSLWARFRKGT